MESFEAVIVVFALLVILHLVVNTKNLQDRYIILLALAVLILFNWQETRGSTESFTEVQPTLPEDTLDPFKTTATLYTTAFNTTSFSQSVTNNKVWKNIAPATNSKPACNDTSSSPANLVFVNSPTYTRETGFTMMNNAITGPLSCSLGISYNATYTIMLCFKTKELLSTGTNIDIFKIFANTPNNNGITLYIPAASIKNISEGFQTCSLILKIGAEEFICSYNASIAIPMESLLTCLWIVKDGANSVKIMYANEKFTSRILSTTTARFDNTNFSNKEFEIASSKNWNVDLFSVGIFNSVFGEDMIKKSYDWMKEIYDRNRAPLLKKMSSTITELTNKNQLLESCPYDLETCTVCNDIQNWKNPVGVLVNASKDCRAGINTFCLKNPTNPICGDCYTEKPSDNCTVVRSMLTNDSARQGILGEMTEEDQLVVKRKNNWYTESECKTVSVPKDNTINKIPVASKDPNTLKLYYKNGNIISEGEDVIMPQQIKEPTSMWSSIKGFFMGK